MHKIIHKLIHYSRGGINLAGGVNAVVSTGEGESSYTSVRSRNRIVQRDGQTWTESEVEAPTEKEVAHDEGNR